MRVNGSINNNYQSNSSKNTAFKGDVRKNIANVIVASTVLVASSAVMVGAYKGADLLREKLLGKSIAEQAKGDFNKLKNLKKLF